MEETSVSQIPEQNDIKEQIGMCTLNTIESMTSVLVGKKVALSQDERRKRLEDMLAGIELARRKYSRFKETRETFEQIPKIFQEKVINSKFEDKFGPAIARMDKIAMSNYIKSLQNNNSEMGRILKKTNIKFAKGNIEDAKNYIKKDWQVGIILRVPIGRGKTTHVFHLGMDKDEKLLDLSDDGAEHTRNKVNEIIQNGSLNSEIMKFQNITGGWNMFMIKKKKETTKI
jgi:hypothetical protein